jgi:methionine--tRNA ligase beta chain
MCKTLLFSAMTMQGESRNESHEEENADNLVLIVVPYNCKIDASKLRQGLKSAGLLVSGKAPRVAPPGRAETLLGFPFNGVCFVGGISEAARRIPIVFADVIMKLSPPLIYLGGGEPDIKLLIANLPEVIKITKAHVLDVTEPRWVDGSGMEVEEHVEEAQPSCIPSRMAISKSFSKQHIGDEANAALGGTKRHLEGKDELPPSGPVEAYDFNVLDVRIGVIRSARLHPASDRLLCEEIDLGEPTGPRPIVSGLQKFYSVEELKEKRVCVVANLKPATLGGEKSFGMVLCASWKKGDTDIVRIVEPPSDAPLGARIIMPPSHGEPVQPANPNAVKKKKIFESVAEHLALDESGKVVSFKGFPVGVVVHKVLKPCTVQSGSPFAKVY